MLHEEHGDAAFQIRQQVLHASALDGAEARHRFVQQEEARLAGERNGEFELLSLAVGERRHFHGAALRQPHPGEQCGRRLLQARVPGHRPQEPEAVALTHLYGQRDVGERRLVRQKLNDLERAADAAPDALGRAQRGDVLAVEANGPGVRPKFSHQLGDEGRLARAVGAYHGVQLARHHVKRDRVAGGEASEALGEAADGEERLNHGGLHYRRRP